MNCGDEIIINLCFLLEQWPNPHLMVLNDLFPPALTSKGFLWVHVYTQAISTVINTVLITFYALSDWILMSSMKEGLLFIIVKGIEVWEGSNDFCKPHSKSELALAGSKAQLLGADKWGFFMSKIRRNTQDILTENLPVDYFSGFLCLHG